MMVMIKDRSHKYIIIEYKGSTFSVVIYYKQLITQIS